MYQESVGRTQSSTPALPLDGHERSDPVFAEGISDKVPMIVPPVDGGGLGQHLGQDE